MYHDKDCVLAGKLKKRSDNKDLDSNKENKKNRNRNIHESSSLVDPSWEYVDPTPDIHVLFTQFDKRFFWNKLKNVVVKWSPRMTSCAGICCYEGRGGLCSVRLSVPLLKLRPRKDLVETLLHEMIHAYLFVTHNNRDRDGHGPEFHKHMYRINEEAGTNISVYHNFHAEVKLYQQHWWRCDGPCQRQPPFFGMVKRSMNRAPGPSDSWYEAHRYSCGGNFIKVREPQVFGKKGAKKITNNKDQSSSQSNYKDIRNFFPVNGAGNIRNNTKTAKGLNPPKPFNRTGKVGESSGTSSKQNNTGRGFAGGMLMNKGGGTFTITANGNKNRPLRQNVSPTKFEGSTPSNVRTITDLHHEATSTISNTSSFPNVKTINGPISKMPSRNFVPFGGAGHTLGTAEGNKENPNRMLGGQNVVKNETSSVRGSSLTSPQPNKRPVAMDSNTVGCSDSKRSAFVTDPNGEVFEIENDLSEAFPTVNCPVCNVQLKEYYLNSHLDICLSSSCEDNASSVVYIEDSPEKQAYIEDNVSCPVCNLKTSKDDLSIHLENCIGNVFVEESIDITDQDSDNEMELADISQTDRKFPCPSCSGLFEGKQMNDHLDHCLSDAF